MKSFTRLFSFLLVTGIFLFSNQAFAQVDSRLRSTQPERDNLEADAQAIKLTHEQAKELIRATYQKELRPDYKIPTYITSEKPLKEVMTTFRNRYPEFHQSSDRLLAIRKDPEKYQEMIRENKAIRKMYTKK